MRARVAFVFLCAPAPTAHAEPWYRGEHGSNRVLHLSLTVGGGLLYPALAPLEDSFAADACRWCEPTAIDRATRDVLRWNDTRTAQTLGDVATYGMTPMVSLGLVLTGTLRDPSWARVIDDVVPILETMVVTEWVTRGLKLAIARQRPYAHFGAPEDEDDNLAFPSGHASRAFALATSAGMVAHLRGYAAEPYIWIGGLTLAATSCYLRIAADRHYVLDVLAGGALGAAAGLTVPLLMRRSPVEVVPTRNGVTVGWVW